MTDSKMPERIWAKPSEMLGWKLAFCTDDQVNCSTEYIRADLAHPALVADAELEALVETAVRNWLGEMEGFATRGERFFDAVQAGDDMMPWLIAAASSALRARTAQPVGVRVKPLEWIRADLSAWGENASAGLIRYNLTWTYRDNPEIWLKVVRYPDCKVIYEGGDEDKAYGAAQADYEQRILSALLPEGGA